MEKFDILIIGAGVIGSFLARDLARYNLKIALLDKENDVGNKTSSANSAIIHSGYDPKPNSLKAKLNVLGNKMYPSIAEELDVHFGQNGSLTVAFSPEEIVTLQYFAKRAKENDVETILLSKEETFKLEPNLSNEIVGSLFAPSAGIIDVFNLVVHLAENAVDNGVKLFLNQEVKNITNIENKFKVETNDRVFVADMVLDCAGVNALQLANMLEKQTYEIKPRKGEYYVLDHQNKPLVSHTIFTLPTEKGKGVLFSMTTSGNYLIGPSSEEVSDFSDDATDGPTLNSVFVKARKIYPDIPRKEIIRVFAGLRASSSKKDFIIEPLKNYPKFIVVGGIESPGLASAPAISKYVIDNYISKLIKLDVNPLFNPRVKKYTNLKELSYEDREKIITLNPKYGQIVCGCEQISLGEIEDLFLRSVPPRSIKGIKKRCRSGYGKCQGGYCFTKLVMILAEKLNIKPTDVVYDNMDSFILKTETKGENDG